MQEGKLYYYKYLITFLQSGDGLFSNGNKVINENGDLIEPSDLAVQNLNWNGLDTLPLGKCGELYAHYILISLGCETYDSVVDDHGIDMLGKKDNKIFKVQVKSIRNDNYTFIKENNPTIDESFYLLYIRVSEEGVPRSYFFPMNYIATKLGKNDNSHYMCFSYRKYIGKNSHPEYGISAAKKYYDESIDSNKLSVDNIGYYCISDGWDIFNDRFDTILKMNCNK